MARKVSGWLLTLFLVSSCGGSGSPDSEQTVPSGPGSNIIYQENFDSLADGSPWPAQWQIAPASNVINPQIQSGMACLTSGPYMGDAGQQNLARMVSSGLQAQNVDIRFDVIFGNFQNQGVGFYARQNGGFFDLSNPAGEGYVVFTEGYSSNGITFWYEEAGDEIQHEIVELSSPLGVDPETLTDVAFSIRYQVESLDANTTIQRAKIWLTDSQTEPDDWTIISDADGTDVPSPESSSNPMTIPSLQAISGGFAIDLFNITAGNETACIDNIVIMELMP